MASDRMRRVNEALREVLSETITNALKDPRIGFVTVTSVDASPDLRNATVYVSVLGEKEKRAESLEGLKSSHGYLQRVVGSALRMKHTPNLTFEYDTTLDTGMRIDALLEQGPDDH